MRKSVFNGNFVFNLLGGKEFILGAKKSDAKFMKRLVIDGKMNWAGGKRYTPIDLQSSCETGKTVYKTKRAYSKQLPEALF